MGRKKKPGGKEKDPPWLEDPYDYSAPWGAPIIRESDIVEELDKAPPLSYFKEHAEEVIQKPKRVRRKKTIFDDLLKDPLTQLREGLELIKRKHQKQEEGLTNAQVDSTKTQEDSTKAQSGDSGRDVQESLGPAIKPSNNNGSLPTSVRGEIEKKAKDIDITNPKMNQKDISVTKKKVQEEASSASRSSPSSTSSSSESDVGKKKKLKKRKKIKNVSELNREIQKLRNELESLRQKTEDQRANEPLKNNRGREKVSDSTRKESDERQMAGKSKLSTEKAVDKEGTKPGNKQDGLSEYLHETFEEFLKRMEEGDASDGETKPDDPVDGTATDKQTDHDPCKQVFTTGSKEKESTKMDAKGSASKEKSKSKKKIKSKREKKKEKEEKMMKEFFKEFDEEGVEDENYSPLKNEGKEHFFEEKGGERVFPARTGVETFSESNSMYGTAPIPLDSEFIQDNETSQKRELQRFLDSTLQPGDGYVLTDKAE